VIDLGEYLSCCRFSRGFSLSRVPPLSLSLSLSDPSPSLFFPPKTDWQDQRSRTVFTRDVPRWHMTPVYIPPCLCAGSQSVFGTCDHNEPRVWQKTLHTCEDILSRSEHVRSSDVWARHSVNTPIARHQRHTQLNKCCRCWNSWFVTTICNLCLHRWWDKHSYNMMSYRTTWMFTSRVLFSTSLSNFNCAEKCASFKSNPQPICKKL